MKLRKNQKVAASMTDSLGRLSLNGTFRIVFDAVTEMMGDMEIDGVTTKRKYDANWVFVRNKIKLDKPLMWNEEMTVESFISSVSSVKMSVDVKVKNNMGEVAIYARVELCALDAQTGRIRRLSTVGVGEGTKVEQAEMEVEFERFGEVDLPVVESTKIRSSNIDMLRHTNNTEYIRFVTNSYSVKELEERKIKEIQVDYCNQSFENDLIEVCKQTTLHKDLVILKCGDKAIIKCMLGLQ